MNSENNWVSSLEDKMRFFINSNEKKRKDIEKFGIKLNDFDSKSFTYILKKEIKSILEKVSNYVPTYSLSWFKQNSTKLWETRVQLENDISKSFYDESLILKVTGHNKYFFQRTYLTDLVSILNNEVFLKDGMPSKLNSRSLNIFDLKIYHQHNESKIKLISTTFNLNMINFFNQYLIKQNDISFIPKPDDIIFDCGACLGDNSVIFSHFLNNKGEVHLFDPVDLHVKFCDLQKSLNPQLQNKFVINKKGVSNQTKSGKSTQKINKISPALKIDDDDFDTIKIDDYAKKNVSRVDYIKMDVEGSEIAALDGAKDIIHEYKPKLAICGYHKPDDYWTIPKKIKELNSEYRIYFEHHSFKMGESVFYAQ